MKVLKVLGVLGVLGVLEVLRVRDPAQLRLTGSAAIENLP